jgi:hypothetical protein
MNNDLIGNTSQNPPRIELLPTTEQLWIVDRRWRYSEAQENSSRSTDNAKSSSTFTGPSGNGPGTDQDGGGAPPIQRSASAESVVTFRMSTNSNPATPRGTENLVTR